MNASLRRSSQLGIFSLAIVVIACGSSVDTPELAGGSASGTGGASASVGSGQSTAAVSASTSGATGTGGGAFCGGKAGIKCPTDQFCLFSDLGTCGNADGGGMCVPKPGGCPGDCPGVCACNGSFYCSACDAQSAGFDVAKGVTCFPDAGSQAIYTAQAIFTDIPRFAIFKSDPTRDICFRIVLGMIDGPSIGIAIPAGWAIETAEVTNHASDCALGGGAGFLKPPLDASASAPKGSGKIDFGPISPCFVDIHAQLFFAMGAPWIPVSEPLDADTLTIAGNCPP